MKLYVILEDTKRIVAISEEEQDVARYIISRNKGGVELTFVKVKGKMAESISLHYDDLFLEHHDKLDVVATRMELRIISQVIGEEKERVRGTIGDLQHYIADYSLDKKSKSRLKKALVTMESLSKTKNLKNVIEVDNVMGYLRKGRNLFNLFLDKIHSSVDRMFILVHDDDK